MADEAKQRKTSTAHEKAKAAARAKRLERAKRKPKTKAKSSAKKATATDSAALSKTTGGHDAARPKAPAKGRSAGRSAFEGQRGGQAKAAGKHRAAPSGAAKKQAGVRSQSLDEREAAAFASLGEEAPANRSGLSCPVERACGACQLLGVPYAEQWADKQRRMEELFGPLADEKTAFCPIEGMESPLYYRNKVMSPYAPGRVISQDRAREGMRRADRGTEAARDGGRMHHARREKPRREILCGMYAAGTHRIIPTDECLLENQTAKRILLAIRQLMPKFRIEPYDEDALEGFLRHAIVRVGHESGEVLVTLVTNGERFPGSRNFARELVKRCPEITTVVQNVNTQNTNAVLGHEGERALYGPGFILDTLCGLSFRISSHSFYQVNAVQTEVLYRRAVEMARLSGGETVLDAYCGTGTIGLVAANSAADVRVIGVDNVASAIADARENAAHNGVENVEFATADAGAFMREMAVRGEHVDVLLMDPPRAGASEEFLRAVAALKPRRVVYISCNPDTQARDVSVLKDAGYRLTAVCPVDMFPHTAHVENICALEG